MKDSARQWSDYANSSFTWRKPVIAFAPRSRMNDWITVDPAIRSGKPVIRGTQILVPNDLGMVAGGYTVAQIVEA